MPASKAWQAVQSIEDALAVLSVAADRGKVIEAHAWNNGSFDAIYYEVVLLRRELAELKAYMAGEWQSAVDIIRGDK